MNPTLTSLVEAIGWALLHCLWQGAVLGICLAVLLRTSRNARAQYRYIVSTMAMAVFVAAFGTTLAVCWPTAPKVPAASRVADLSVNPVVPGDAQQISSPSKQPEAAKNSAPAKRPEFAFQAPSSSTQSSAASAVPTSWRERFRPQLPWAVAIWAAGVLFFAIRFLLSWLTVRRWVERAVPVTDQTWTARLAEISTALRISRPVRLLVSTALTAPAVIGWLKPVVLVPAGIFTGLTAGQVEAILTHELAHIRRHDYLVNLLQTLVETLFFFHPAAWWISCQMRREREHCCDDLAAALSGGALSYAKALAALEVTRNTAPALAQAASGGSLVDRIRRLLGVPEPKSTVWPLGVLVVGLAAIVFSLSWVQVARAESGPVLSAEATDGTYQSYCVYQGDAIRFLFIARTQFDLKKEADPETGALDFPKAKRASAHEIHFAPAPDVPDLLVVSPPGNLHFHYDLTRSRVFFVDFDRHGFSPVIHQIPFPLKPITSPELLTESATQVVQWLAAADDVQQYEYTREQVPETDYKPGKPLAQANHSIIWGEPNEVGLRLGVGGLETNAEIAVGQLLPIKQFIRNDGPATLRLSATGIFNEGTDGTLTDKGGISTPLKRGYPAQMFFSRVKLAPGEFVELGSAPLQTILANRDGSPATSQRAYTSSFVVTPGEHTLRLSHHIGKFLGIPANANVGDPRLAPGLGEWTGTLQAAPITFHFTAPAVDTAKPGSFIEIETTYRLQFQKGQIVLSLRANGMTHAATWMVDESENWPTPGGNWKTTDPSGDYLAAWDVGSTRLWYVDSSGVQRLDIGRQLVDGGHWTMAEATGPLGNMPDKVRQALKLPAKKSPEISSDGPMVRGISLAGVESTDDPLSLTEIFESVSPPPASNDLSRRAYQTKPGIFEMPLYGEKPSTTLVVPKERREYYLELMGRIYGPIAGNAAEDLGLAEIIRGKIVEKPNLEGVVLLENLLRNGSEPLRALACRLVVDLPESTGPFDYDTIFRAGIDYSIESESTFTVESGVGLQHIRALLFAAREQWEKRRAVLPDGSYISGEPVAAEQPDVVWGEPDPAGLRLGVSGLIAVNEVAIGKTIPVQFILRNDGPATVKLSWDPVWNGPLLARLIGHAGKKFAADFKFSGGLTDYRRSRLDPGQQLKLPATELEFYATRNDVENAPNKNGFEYNPRFDAPVGAYTLHIDYRVGKAEYADPTLLDADPAKVEWTGVLSMKPVPLAVIAP